jgi:hypothetical protein
MGPVRAKQCNGLDFYAYRAVLSTIGALVLIAGLVVFAFDRRALAQADLQSR